MVFRMAMLWISLVARGTVAAEWSWHTSISLKSFFGTILLKEIGQNLKYDVFCLPAVGFIVPTYPQYIQFALPGQLDRTTGLCPLCKTFPTVQSLASPISAAVPTFHHASRLPWGPRLLLSLNWQYPKGQGIGVVKWNLFPRLRGIDHISSSLWFCSTFPVDHVDNVDLKSSTSQIRLIWVAFILSCCQPWDVWLISGDLSYSLRSRCFLDTGSIYFDREMRMTRALNSDLHMQ